MRRRLALLLLAIVPASGCGGGASDYASGYGDDAAAACRAFNEVAFEEQISVARAGAIYAGFESDLERLAPPGEMQRLHDVLLRAARGSRKLFQDGPPTDDEPKVDLRLTLGDWTQDDLEKLARDLPDCADSLTGTHPEIQVIR